MTALGVGAEQKAWLEQQSAKRAMRVQNNPLFARPEPQLRVIKGGQAYRQQHYQTGAFLGEMAVKNNRATVVITSGKVWRLFPNDDAQYILNNFGGNTA